MRKRSDWVSGIACILALALGLCGCSGSAAPFIGRWKGHYSRPKPENMEANMHEFATRVVVEMKSDGKFVLLEAGMPKEGDYSASGDTAKLRIKSIMGQSVSKAPESVRKNLAEITMTLQKDGSVLLEDPLALVPEKIRLEKQQQPEEESSRKQ